jgi:hypothetical protein
MCNLRWRRKRKHKFFHGCTGEWPHPPTSLCRLTCVLSYSVYVTDCFSTLRASEDRIHLSCDSGSHLPLFSVAVYSPSKLLCANRKTRRRSTKKKIKVGILINSERSFLPTPCCGRIIIHHWPPWEINSRGNVYSYVSKILSMKIYILPYPCSSFLWMYICSWNGARKRQ